MLLKHFFIILTVIIAVFRVSGVYAQLETEVECGMIVENEFFKPAEDHIYTLTMEPGSSFNVSAEAVGDNLRIKIFVEGPTGVSLTRSEWEKSPSINSGALSSSKGKYSIKINNETTWSGKQLVGLYTLSIGCIQRNGEVINPGDIPQPTPTPAPLPTATPRSALPDTASTFTGTGFPGLAPVDFADAVPIPLLLDEKMTGVIPLDNQILGFTLDAAAGDTLDLSYTRVSGNMNLGLVVLSAENEVFFQASLVTSASLATQFILPAAGQYTIGVFRISLVEPAAVEPTVFQLKVTTAD